MSSLPELTEPQIRRYARHNGGQHVTLEYIAIRNLTMGDDDVEAIRKNLADVPPPILRKIIRDNAVRVYNLG